MRHLKLLADLYGQPHRHYHTLVHIGQMFADAAKASIVLTDVQVAAIFWHDAVYDPQASDNEEQSAALMRANVVAHPEILDAISDIIIDTKTHIPRSYESAVVCDLDLLGLAGRNYFKNEELIRAEYAHLSEEEWVEGRMAFLNRMLNRNIFRTSLFAGREAWAQDLIETELRTLIAVRDRLTSRTAEDSGSPNTAHLRALGLSESFIAGMGEGLPGPSTKQT